MKKHLVVFSAFLLIVAGCAPLRESTQVVDNVFSSRSLFVNVKVSPDFKYLAGEDTGTFGNFYHIFAEPVARKVKRIIIIDCHYMTPSPSLSGQWYYAYSPFDDKEVFFDSGDMQFNNDTFYYAVNTITTSRDTSMPKWIIKKAYRMPVNPLRVPGPDPELRLHNDEFYYDIDTITTKGEESIPRLITEKGYGLPYRLMVKRMATILQGNYHFMVYYFEDIDDLGFSGDAWGPHASLAENQKEFLKQFDERFRGSMAFFH